MERVLWKLLIAKGILGGLRISGAECGNLKMLQKIRGIWNAEEKLREKVLLEDLDASY